MFVIHLGCSFLIPVLLIHRYEASKEKIRKLAKRNGRDIRVPVWVQKCRIIKSQIVEFFKIELGRWLMGVSNGLVSNFLCFVRGSDLSTVVVILWIEFNFQFLFVTFRN